MGQIQNGQIKKMKIYNFNQEKRKKSKKQLINILINQIMTIINKLEYLNNLKDFYLLDVEQLKDEKKVNIKFIKYIN